MSFKVRSPRPNQVTPSDKIDTLATDLVQKVKVVLINRLPGNTALHLN